MDSRSLLCSWRSKITSKGFLVTEGKVFTGRLTVTYRKQSWAHPTGEGALWLYSTHSQEAAQVEDLHFLQQLALIWAQGSSTPSAQVGSTGANNLPVLPGPATPLHQVLNQRFKPWPNGSITESYYTFHLGLKIFLSSVQFNPLCNIHLPMSADKLVGWRTDKYTLSCLTEFTAGYSRRNSCPKKGLALTQCTFFLS